MMATHFRNVLRATLLSLQTLGSQGSQDTIHLAGSLGWLMVCAHASRGGVACDNALSDGETECHQIVGGFQDLASVEVDASAATITRSQRQVVLASVLENESRWSSPVSPHGRAGPDKSTVIDRITTTESMDTAAQPTNATERAAWDSPESFPTTTESPKVRLRPKNSTASNSESLVQFHSAPRISANGSNNASSLQSFQARRDRSHNTEVLALVLSFTGVVLGTACSALLCVRASVLAQREDDKQRRAEQDAIRDLNRGVQSEALRVTHSSPSRL